ncbi:MAG: DedA family protein [Crocinitomicaceae bacterium]|jgi:membrane-associated protein|nr:DedA family protein [Crocinitomicaceae bacterium]MDP4761575.1 DedA family protein [Crocinitomicaceae bacterium]
MTLLKDFLDFFLHLDDHLFVLIQDYGIWIYAILFLIIFVETGLVVMPFLPGDSLLFVAGTFCAGFPKETEITELNLWLVLLLLIIAAILGDGVNYFLGKTIGAKVLQWKIGKRQLVKQKYIDQTQAFYEKHGSKTIIIARFVPIVRTFAPFVAGIGAMSYSKFLKFNIIGGIAWVCGLTLLGYFFGKQSFVQKNFELVIFGIIGLSLVPMVFEILRAKLGSK